MRVQEQRNTLIGLVVGTWLLAASALPAQGPNAQQAQRAETGGYGATSIGEATFQIDPETGSLIVITDAETNKHIQEIVKNLDKPIPQVLIKVLFLEVTHSNDLDLGVEASYRSGSKTVVDANGNETEQFEDTLETLFGVASETQGAFYRLMKDDLDMTIRALAQVGKLEVLSRPSILTRNNEQAVITLGEEVPMISNSRVTQDGQIINTVQYVDVGIILDVTPHIRSDGLVEMDVAPEISTISGETVQVSENFRAFVIAKRAAETTVVVPDGMTVVIGGLMENNHTDSVRKVPILGDIPWAGTLFRRSIKSKTKTELLIFLTPHVVERTSGLDTLSASESKKAKMAPAVFSPEELDKHLEGHEKLFPRPQVEKGPRGLLKRAGSWAKDTIEAFK